MSVNKNKRQVLDDWIYAERHLLTTFQADLLEKHAIAQLARALNSNRLIAVIGSGVSAGYGHPRWYDLLVNTADLLETLISSDRDLFKYYECLKDGRADKGEATSERSRIVDIAPILETFFSFGIGRKDTSFSEDQIPVAFEICENLFAAISTRKLGRRDPTTAKQESRRARRLLRDRLKWQLKDDRGRMELLISRILKRGAPDQQDGKAEITRIRDSISFPVNGDRPPNDCVAAWASHLLYRGAPRLVRGKKSSTMAADRRADGISLLLPLMRKKSKEKNLLAGLIARRLVGSRVDGPDIRYMIEAAFDLLSTREIADVLTGLEAAACLAAEEDRDGLGMRAARAVTPRTRDPLAVILDDLRVKRILTTNYDGEVDRLLDARGYRPLKGSDPSAFPADETSSSSAPSRSLLIDSSSSRAEILAYEPGASAYLFDYGADTREHRIQVLHIHGRARSPESWLVLSEPDYRERYARDDDPRARADDAMRLVFGANPLLFLGLGMKEPDILRPLRAFSEDVSRLCDRPAIALLPRTAARSSSRYEQVQSLSRYGVYITYYGHADWAPKDDRGKLMDYRSDENFMADLLSFNRAAKAHLNGTDKTYRPPGDNAVLHGDIKWVEGSRSARFAASDIQRHIRLLDSLLKERPEAPRKRKRKKPVRGPLSPETRSALLTISDGITSAVLTTFMTAWLKRMVIDWSEWHEDWSRAPRRREPGGAASHPVDAHLEVSRHRTLLRNLDRERNPTVGPSADDEPLRAPETDRFFAGAPSPALQVLRASMAGKFDNPRGRRLFYILSERGHGRGQLFSAMRSPTRFAHLCDWLGITTPNPARSGKPELDPLDRRGRDHTANVHSAFLNLGLSHEIISTFDRLAHLLEGVASNLGGKVCPPEQHERFGKIAEQLRNDRMARVRNALEYLSEIGARGAWKPEKGGMPRLVVVINHLNVLFERDGRPKNTQVRRFFETLVDDAFSAAPVDFIFLMNENQLPTSLVEQAQRSTEKKASVRLLRPDGLPGEVQRALQQRIKRALGVDSLPGLARGQPGNVEGPHTYVHFLLPLRPATLAVRFFPRAAAALAVIADPAALAAEEGDDAQGGKLGAPRREPAGGVSEASTSDLIAYFGKRKACSQPADVVAFLGFQTDKAVRNFQVTVRAAFEKRLAARAGAFHTDVDAVGAGFADNRVDDIMINALIAQAKNGKLSDVKSVIGAAIKQIGLSDSKPPSVRIKRCFDDMASAVGHNRYALTVVLAAIDDMIARRLPGDPENKVDLAAIDLFVKRLKLNTASKAPNVRDDIAIAQVLRLYQTDTVTAVGDPMKAWPFVPGLSDRTGATGSDEAKARSEMLYKAKPHLLYDLQEQILVALAMIGQPVEASVLTGISSVAHAFEALVNDVGLFGRSRSNDVALLQECFLRVMDLLVHRCLVFRISPKGPDKMSNANRTRFATHKSLRRHLYRQFNAPIIDYSDVDQLTMSLYATQPNDLPRPTADGHRRVRRLIDELSLFEKARDDRAHSALDPFLDDQRLLGEEGREARYDVIRGRLRASYGALRSIYSVAVISRFSSYEAEGLETPENGYFENHRTRVRWMLRLASRLDDVWTKGGEEAEKSGSHTFHAEEIVWLFNECGVLSLAQGRMNDAAALLLQAKRIARDFIEAPGWGPLHARIGVNKAVVDIQLGRFRDAEETLRRVAEERSGEHEALVLVAKGYQTLIQDLRGNAAGAAEAYPRIVKKLAKLGRYRSAAIFSIQYADCLRQRGGEHVAAAIVASEQGCAYAAEGGHEDIRQIGQLAQVAAEIVRRRASIHAAERRDIEDRLDGIAAYASLMGMPRLTCSVALQRGQFYLDQGDYRSAAEQAQEALRIATRHDIELRKVSALSLLGTAMLKLKLPEARSLLIRARELAYHADYTSAISSIEEALGEFRGVA